jgi:hypothetical protein
MHGLTVRWSLDGRDRGVLSQLRAYVRDSSHARFSGMEGLRFKTWRARDGEWFEGSYVFETPGARDRFQRQFTENAERSQVTQIVGSAPVLIEPCEVVAVAEGGSGFAALASYDHDTDPG